MDDTYRMGPQAVGSAKPEVLADLSMLARGIEFWGQDKALATDCINLIDMLNESVTAIGIAILSEDQSFVKHFIGGTFATLLFIAKQHNLTLDQCVLDWFIAVRKEDEKQQAQLSGSS